MPDFIKLTSVDLSIFKLPVFDEEVIPATIRLRDVYKHVHSRAWSDKIRRHDGDIFIVLEYNYGIAGATKNAIDYLKNKWITKPAIVVWYGLEEGNFANDQVHNSLTRMRLRVPLTRPMMPFKGNVGPDAILGWQGQLGQDSVKSWEETQTVPILIAFSEF